MDDRQSTYLTKFWTYNPGACYFDHSQRCSVCDLHIKIGWRKVKTCDLHIKIGWRKVKTCRFGAAKWLQSARLEHNTQRHAKYVLHTSASKVNTASEKCPRRGKGRVCRQIWIALAGNLSRQSCGRYVWEGVFEHVVGIVEVLSAGTRQRGSGRGGRRTGFVLL